MINIHNFCFKKKFFILLPPPNVTGELHIGHFFQYFIIDILIKWKFLQNFKIFFIFGFDHAGISAIIKFKNKKKIFNFKKKIEKKIQKQFFYINFLFKNKKIEFTLNKKYKKNIEKYFFLFLKKNIIFIKKKIIKINEKFIFLSDSDILKKIFFKKLYFIKYKNEKNNIIISTTNIISLINSNFILSYKNEKDFVFSPFKIRIKCFLNKYIKKKWGTGNLKISPIDNNFDYIIFKDYKKNYFFEKKSKYLKKIKLKNNNFYNSKLKIKIKKKVSKLKIIIFLIKNNYLICIKTIKSHNFINNKYKIKNLIIDQWFLKIRKIFSIKKIFKKIKSNIKNNFFLLNWIRNVSDWCISRQIKWGIIIPFYVDKENNIIFLKNKRYLILKKNKEVFDTWYNSSIWLIYSYNNFKKKHNILVSGYDIVFFWISKMLIFNVLIFKKKFLNFLFLHGLIKDNLNRKISKSINNVINFKHVKKNINKLRIFLLEKINLINIKINFKKKNNFFFLKKKNKNIKVFLFYKNKFSIIKNYINFNFLKIINKKKESINENFLNKKIFILNYKLFSPFKKILKKKEWNFSINFYFYFYLYLNLFIIIKIFNKFYLLKNFKILNYCAIFYNLQKIIYVKYKI